MHNRMRPALTIQINLCVSQSVKDCQGVDFNKCTTTTTTNRGAPVDDKINYWLINNRVE